MFERRRVAWAQKNAAKTSAGRTSPLVGLERHKEVIGSSGISLPADRERAMLRVYYEP